jgi:hypothetical protein
LIVNRYSAEPVQSNCISPFDFTKEIPNFKSSICGFGTEKMEMTGRREVVGIPESDALHLRMAGKL